MPDNRPPIRSLLNTKVEDPHQGFLDFYNTPLVPESAIQGLQGAIDPGPSLERSPWEARLRGFGAGALEGLRQQTTPLNLAQLALVGIGGGVAPGAGRALGASAKAAKAARPVAGAMKSAPMAKGPSIIKETIDKAYDLSGPNVPSQLQAWRQPGRLPGVKENFPLLEETVVNAYRQAGPTIPPQFKQPIPTSTWGNPRPQSLPPQMSNEVQALMEALTKIGVK